MYITIRKPLSFSEIGRKDMQEDCLFPSAESCSSDDRVFILCDGVGGHEHGEVASGTVCAALGSYLNDHGYVKQDATSLFKDALSYAYDELDKKDTGDVKKMGTTMTCLYIHEKGCTVAHIGDSRIYHIRPSFVDLTKNRSGILYQSSDHSLVNDLLRAGEITPEEARDFPQKNVITRAMQPHLGHRDKADVFTFSDVRSGDYFFLCCDGVLEQLTNDTLCEILAHTDWSDEEKIQAIKRVCDNKTRDNYTCFLIPIDKVKTDGEEMEQENMVMAEVEEPLEVNCGPEHRSSVCKYRLLLWIVVVLVVALAGGITYRAFQNKANQPIEKEKPTIPKIEKRTQKRDSIPNDSTHQPKIKNHGRDTRKTE
jgi:protein phosphatase